MNTASNHSIYAQWTANTYTVTFVYGNGSANTTKTVTYDSTYGTLPTPTRTNYTFLGWYNDNAKIENTTIVKITSNITLTAQWVQTKIDFAYTGSYKEVTLPAGNYKIELWGAQGGTNDETYYGGYGAYTAGEIKLNVATTLYVFVGQKGQTLASSFNGGGVATRGDNTRMGEYYTTVEPNSGGGATDIRTSINSDTLNSRIMVAAGGGAGGNLNLDNGGTGSHGGGLIGYIIPNIERIEDPDQYTYRGTRFPDIPATQFYGGYISSPDRVYPEYQVYGSFGLGGYWNETEVLNGANGGAGGYYGGGSSVNMHGSGGGSSFISGHPGSVAVASSSSITPRKDSNNIVCSSSTSSGYNSNGYNTDYICSLHYSGYYFSNTTMIDGKGYKWTITNKTLSKEYTQMPLPNGTLANGKVENGYARITCLGY